jgi:clan AA aspartic protease (TIGR02281 family)
LVQWDPDKNLSWYSIVSGKGLPSVKPRVKSRSEHIVAIRSELFPTEPGLLFQGDNVVGWTFGPSLDGILWTGSRGESLREEVSIRQFYSMTFENGREEQFLKALATGGESPASEYLKALAEGFRRSPALSVEHTPQLLQARSVIALMRKLVGQLLGSGFEREVADILDVDILYIIGEVDLMIKALEATETYYGYLSAADLADDLYSETDRFNDSHLLTARIKKMYIDWIIQRIDQKDPLEGWRIYERASKLFPEDPAIRLLGAEIHLMDDDWRSAEALVPTDAIPSELYDHVEKISARIAGLRAEEGKIVIRFDPGLRHIPFMATINDRIEQDFVIDTGASMVTIPSNTADAAGIHVNENSPVRMVSTAGGPAEAREIILDVINLKGTSVKNIKAWVLDIPGRPETGLLGLNFLNRFHMEINSDEGTLMLTPRRK